MWECNITGIPSALQNLLFKKKIEKSLYESNVFFLDLCFIKFFDIHIRNISTPVIPLSPYQHSTLWFNTKYQFPSPFPHGDLKTDNILKSRSIGLFYSVLQSDRNSLGGYFVVDSINMACQ